MRDRRIKSLLPSWKKNQRGGAMNAYQKYFSACLLALLGQAALAQSSAPPLSSGLQSFAVLSGGAVTCTTSLATGNVGAGGAFTNTGCTFAGGTPPATNAAAASALADFASAYAALQGKPCTQGALGTAATIPASMTLTPGTYCTGAALTATGVTLTLDAQNDPNAVWIFQIGAALTGTNFSVVMANGGQACNVFWVPGAGVTMTTSTLKGNIVAGGATGSITLTGGNLDGRALAKVAVTMTDSVVGCGGLAAALGSLSCKKKHKHHGDRDDDDEDDDDDHDHDGKDRGHKKNPFGKKDD
jgi:Ice-binding-like